MAGTGLLLGMLMIWLIMAIYYRYPVIFEFIAAAGWVPIYFIAYLVGYKYKAIMIAKIMGESER